jgi:hypothetical protein
MTPIGKRKEQLRRRKAALMQLCEMQDKNKIEEAVPGVMAIMGEEVISWRTEKATDRAFRA